MVYRVLGTTKFSMILAIYIGISSCLLLSVSAIIIYGGGNARILLEGFGVELFLLKLNNRTIHYHNSISWGCSYTIKLSKTKNYFKNLPVHKVNNSGLKSCRSDTWSWSKYLKIHNTISTEFWTFHTFKKFENGTAITTIHSVEVDL